MIKISLRDGTLSLSPISQELSNTVEITLGGKTLPVNPAEITYDISGSNEKVTIVGLGQVVIPGKRNLRTLNLESYFPDKSYVDFFMKAWDDKKPLPLVITGLDLESFSVVIEDFSQTKKAGEHHDTYYSLGLVEYVPYGALEINANGETNTAQPTAPQRSTETKPDVPRNYNVISNDNIWSTAKMFSGSGDNWRDFYDLNELPISENGNNIVPNLEVRIPEGWIPADQQIEIPFGGF